MVENGYLWLMLMAILLWLLMASDLLLVDCTNLWGC